MNYVKSWEQPDYPHGNWINEDEWTQTGMEEIMERAGEAYEVEVGGLEDCFYGLYSENDMGMERLIPLEYSGNNFETVRGVFDSNPGVTQRYTPWRTTYTEKELEKDLEAMDGKLIELEDEEIGTVRESFSPDFEEEINFNAIVNGIAGVFWKR